ncbi:hypothetical protein B4966_08600 [Rhodocyclaceae bacterium]|nr:hypothetical protein B4966_08600 [Rhodocyclaceae bacterium]
MLSCKEATRLCSEALDRPLSLRERLALRMHLMMCSGCTNYHDQMAFIRNITARFARGEFAADPDTQRAKDTDTPSSS